MLNRTLRWPPFPGPLDKLGSPRMKDGPDDGTTEAECGATQTASYDHVGPSNYSNTKHHQSGNTSILNIEIFVDPIAVN